MAKNHYLRNVLFVYLSVTIIFILIVILLSQYLPSNQQLVEWGKKLVSQWGILGVFTIVLIGGTIVPFPSPAVVASAIAFAKHQIIPIVIAAILAGTTASYINFSLARIFRNKFVLKHMDIQTMKAFQSFWNKYGEAILWINGLVPFLLFDPLTLIAGLSEMKKERFLTIAIITRTFMYITLSGLTLGIIKIWFPIL